MSVMTKRVVVAACVVAIDVLFILSAVAGCVLLWVTTP